MTRPSLQILATWSLLCVLLGLAWGGAAAACEFIGIASGRSAALSGACLVITILAALVAANATRSCDVVER